MLRSGAVTDTSTLPGAAGVHGWNKVEFRTAPKVGFSLGRDVPRCGRFKVSKVGEEYFTYLTECQDSQQLKCLYHRPVTRA